MTSSLHGGGGVDSTHSCTDCPITVRSSPQVGHHHRSTSPNTHTACLCLCLQTVLGIILGGGAGTRLYPLTKKRAKPAVPLGANYRLIDIPVSNCVNSNVTKIYCLTQFNSASLNRHLSQAYVSDAQPRGTGGGDRGPQEGCTGQVPASCSAAGAALRQQASSSHAV